MFLDDYFISGISYLKGLWKARYDLPNAGPQGYRITREKESTSTAVERKSNTLLHLLMEKREAIILSRRAVDLY